MSVSPPDLTTESESEMIENPAQTNALPDASDLEDKMPLWFRSSWLLILFVMIGCLLFLYFSFLPVNNVSIWGDLAYGEKIWQTKTIPQTEPFMLLSEGVEMTNNSWLSQLGLYHLYMWRGVPALQFFHASTLAAIVIGLFLSLSYYRCQQAVCTLVGLVFFLWINWQQLHIISPQLAGLCCFILMWGLLQIRKWTVWHYVALFVLFVGWVNLHASFVVGMTVLLTCCLGSLIDLIRRTDGIKKSFAGSRFRRSLAILELALLATLLNPFGLRIYSGVASLMNSENLQDTALWQEITIRSSQGQAVAFISLMLMIVYRMTPRRISTTEVFQLIGLGATALWMRHMVIWWSLVAAWYFVWHASAIWKKAARARQPNATEPQEKKSLWTVVAIGIIFIVWGLSPIGYSLLHGHDEKFDLRLSQNTPMQAVSIMLEDREKGNLPPGQIFNSLELGDYIVWRGDKNPLPIFAAPRAHLIPREVWQHYHQITAIGAGWDELLAKYGVNVVLIDRQLHGNLGAALIQSRDWEKTYENRQTMLLYRKTPVR